MSGEHTPSPFEDPDVLAAALGQENRPTSQQRDVITSGLSPLLVVAGAGSGKTATMADRVVWLVANGLARPEEILGVTFTRKAAGELAERLRGHLRRLRSVMQQGQEADLGMEPSVSTYHSFAKTLVAEQGMRIGLEPDAPVWGPAQCWQLATKVVDAYDGPHQHLHSSHGTLVEGVLGYASQAAEHLVDPAGTVDWLLERADGLEELPFGATARSTKPSKEIDRLRTHATVARLAADYQEAKARRGIMDYGDLVAFAARLALLPEVQAQYRSRYKVVLLDEFQDTSHAQIELFARLFADGRHAVTAVGDPNQAIYGFRGASAGQLAAFTDRFATVATDGTRTPAPVTQLTTAWRNSRSILDAANLIARPLNRRQTLSDAAEHAAVPDVAGAPTDPCDADHAGVLAPSRITLPRPAGLRVDALEARPAVSQGRVVLAHAVIAAQEARELADFLQREREAWRQAKGAWPSVAVLTRKRATMAPVAEELRSRGIPVEVVGLGGLLTTPEVQDVVATLRVIADPGRSDALMRLLAGARWRIGPADLMALGDYAQFRAKRRAAAVRQLRRADFETPDGQAAEDRGHVDGNDLVDQASLVEALDHLPRGEWVSRDGRTLGEAARARLARLAAELRRLRRLLGEELPLLVAEVVSTLGLDVEVLSRPGRDEHAARRHLDAFADVVARFDGGDGEAELPAFLEWLDAASTHEGGLSTSPEPAEDGTVQLLTVHASKGLEWDIVAVPALNAGTFPSGQVTRWTKSFAELPWPLRGDASELPQLSALDDPAAVFEHQKEYEEFEKGTKEEGYALEVARHAEKEERRLAYVAFTRARSVLWCSASDFSGLSKKRVEPSPFFSELAACLAPQGEGLIAPELALEDAQETGRAPEVERGPWQEAPAELEENPEAGIMLRGEWPYDPLAGATVFKGEEVMIPRVASRRPGLEAAALDVRTAREALLASGEIPRPGSELGLEWDQEARQLLQERAEAGLEPELIPPRHVRASLFVEAADDREAVEKDLRRPVPHRPGVAATQGTEFHQWVESRFEAQGHFDLDDDALYSDARDAGDAGGEAGEGGVVPDGGTVGATAAVEQLKAKFLASEWANRQPEIVEAALETRIGPVSVRGRIDAVFKSPEGRWDLVDWKTGRVPTAAELPKKSLQLAVYRLAWSRLHGVPLDQIDAAFYYVAHGKTVRPPRLADEAHLEALITELFATEGQ
ncbi:ATP-dependent DNA helicase [Galactobacter caseinivorans]|uniref:DNA 3'-5' helicase n=1 Tax=Galactobacter caseinivorans TaxID=2676123 RepID=A0A496PMD0_9MICC|nr:ATP-dependent DNA helicase [Galactobacter caseinivorans]RKW71619.1 ATP-dependent helicase [Galactobacter caseinivorans]